MFTVGLVGCGGIAKVHAKALNSLDNIRFAACADIVPEKAQAFADEFGPTAYHSLQDMLENEHLDALHICTPHYLHTPMACMAADRGIAVFTEKPPVTSRDDWSKLTEAGKKVPVGICFQNRYNSCVKKAEAMIASGIYGSLIGARAFVTWNRTASYYTGSSWRGKWETECGGALINQSIHTLDLLLRFMGKPVDIQSHMYNHHLNGIIEVEDTVEAYLRFDGDKQALFYATTAYSRDSDVIIELQCEEAALRLEQEHLYLIEEHNCTPIACDSVEAFGKSYWGSGHLTCIADFYDSIQNHRPFQNDIASVQNTMDVMLRMYEQAQKDGFRK